MKKTISIFTISLFLSTCALANAVSFTDTFFSSQWGVINTGQVIQRATGETTRVDIDGIKGADINYLHLTEDKLPKDREVIVAVLDSGVDIHHKDLVGRIWTSEECAPSEVSPDFKIKCAGFDFLDRQNSVKDDVGHGTHVAGLIAANANDIGIVGIAPHNIKIMPVKILNNKAKDFIYDRKYITDIFADGINFARRHGADIINLSLGWPKLVHTDKIKREIRLAQEAGILIVAASGNNNKQIPVFPCTSAGVLCVGAVDNKGEITEFTNYGGKIDILAPGEAIISTYPMNVESRTLRITGYEKKRGSSQAAPYISGIAAVVKLMNPGISLNELKGRLFNSARSVEEAKSDDKSAKYGLVDMKKAVLEKPAQFITPDFKNLLEVEYKAIDGSFSFNLPIESLIGEAKDVKISLSFDNPSIELVTKRIIIPSLSADMRVNNFITGKITDLQTDANTVLNVKIETKEGFSKTASTLISFARNFKNEKLETFKIEGVDARLLSYFGSGRKISRMKKVEDPFNRAIGPEYHYEHPKKQTEEQTVISLIRIEDNKYSNFDLSINKISKLLKVFRTDVNGDGSPDYMTYSISKDEENLLLHFFDSQLNPLFKDLSEWKLPITTFEGLPIDPTQIPFKWLKVQTKEFGSIRVPAITREWLMPEEDNSGDILDSFEGQSRHLYYLLPSVKNKNEVILNVRAVDSASMYEDLAQATEASFDEDIEVHPPFFQTKKEADLGVITTLVSVGKEFVRRYYLLTVTAPGKYSILRAPFDGRFFAQNDIFPLTDVKTGNHASESAFMVRFDKKRARVSTLDPHNGSQLDFDFESLGWSDAVNTFIGGFTDGKNQRNLFIESRFYVWSLKEDGSQSKLRINRDSAFPGVQFAETMMPIVIEKDGKGQAGVYINSTLIFGDRLYTMIQEEKGLVRPAALSANMPSNCLQLEPSRLGETSKSSYVMLCVDSKNRAEIKFFPLSL